MSEGKNNGAESFETGRENSPVLTVMVALLLAAHFARVSLPDVDTSTLSLRLPPAIGRTSFPIPFTFR